LLIQKQVKIKTNESKHKNAEQKVRNMISKVIMMTKKTKYVKFPADYKTSQLL